MILLLASPASGAERPRDTVIAAPSVGSARISASASTDRYPIDDGSGETVAISVTAACQATCTAADPQQIADFLGTLIHGFEMELLTVQLDTPTQIEFDCGYGAEACYYGNENKIVLSGNDTPAPEGASREFVLAHEYGHHVANHRESPPPFPAAIDWGTPRWSSYEHVCQGSRAGALFPGNEGLHYFRDPGEAFAESFAHLRFPESHVPWRWAKALEPDRGAFRAIREDTLDPWLGRSVFKLQGRIPARQGGTVRGFRTPLDGMISLRPAAGRPHYSLSLLSPAGRVLRSSGHDLSFRHRLNFTVCGQSRLRVAIGSAGHGGGAFKLQVQRP
ncbi:MAG TPA: hypothetical protein VLK56_08985 [Solirubrobacterales bacterium]|nr:hypothetical protein [Solirubrobacterales bacterium]